jgi:cyclophilin family peptidyl-prolyl cis-trans isomerase
MPRQPMNRLTAVLLLLLVGAMSCSSDPEQPEPADPARTRVVLRTTAGDLTLALFPGQAPRTVRQFLRLARAGVFDTTYFFSVAPGFLIQTSWAYDRARPISPEQRSLITRIPLESSDIPHTRGVLSMGRGKPDDPDSAETSFCIMLGRAPQLDGKYTVFGRVESGFEVLDKIEKLGTSVATRPRSRIEVKQVVVEDAALSPRPGPAAPPAPGATGTTAAAVAPAAQGGTELSPSCHPAAQQSDPAGHEAGGMMASPPAARTDSPVSISDRLDTAGQRVRTVLFRDLHIDRVYPSMHGPWAQRTFKLAPESPRVWLTGYRAEVLDGGTGRASQEFMCHTNLDLVGTASAPPELRQGRAQLSISQGQTELRFPRGFALPLDNDASREVRLTAMVLNSNYPGLDRRFDFKSTVRYLDDAAARQRGYRPLFQTSVYTVCPTEPPTGAGDQTPACEPATPWEVHDGPYARRQTGHWLVPPGRQVITHDVTAQLNLPYDTTVHYIWVHLHPYGQRMELRDTTTGQMVWTGRARNHPRKALLLSTDHYASTEGIRLYKDHRYALTTVYDNRSGKRVTAMAALWMYLRAHPGSEQARGPTVPGRQPAYARLQADHR